MKKLIMLMTVVMLALSLGACATKTASQKKVPIKCPACGYEGLDYIYQP